MRSVCRPVLRLLLLPAVGLLSVAALADWQLDWSTIDAGGELEAQGGDWTLSGTIGQWDASAEAALTGGPWQLTGGFWQGADPPPQTGDRIFSDRFED